MITTASPSLGVWGVKVCGCLVGWRIKQRISKKRSDRGPTCSGWRTSWHLVKCLKKQIQNYVSWLPPPPPFVQTCCIFVLLLPLKNHKGSTPWMFICSDDRSFAEPERTQCEFQPSEEHPSGAGGLRKSRETGLFRKSGINWAPLWSKKAITFALWFTFIWLMTWDDL